VRWYQSMWAEQLRKKFPLSAPVTFSFLAPHSLRSRSALRSSVFSQFHLPLRFLSLTQLCGMRAYLYGWCGQIMDCSALHSCSTDILLPCAVFTSPAHHFFPTYSSFVPLRSCFTDMFWLVCAVQMLAVCVHSVLRWRLQGCGSCVSELQRRSRSLSSPVDRRTNCSHLHALQRVIHNLLQRARSRTQLWKV